MRTHAVLALSLGLALFSLPAAAEDAVGNVGLRSVDVPTASLAPLEAALDRAISSNAMSARGKTATLGALAADPEIAKRRADGRRAADAGANSMRQLDLDTAQTEFDKATTFLVAAHGDRLEPSDLGRIYTTRAKVAQMQRTPLLVKGEFEKAVPLHATKQLDPATFPPDVIQIWTQALNDAARAPIAPPGTAQLLDIARRTSLKWIVAGEVRDLGPAGYRVSLAVVDDTGAAKSVEFVAPSENLVEAFDKNTAKLFAEANVTRALPALADALVNEPTTSVTPVATPVAVAVVTPRPVPTQALPRPTPAPARKTPGAGGPWYKNWYIVGAIAVLAVGAGAVAASSGGGDSGGGEDPDPDEGVTLVIDTP